MSLLAHPETNPKMPKLSEKSEEAAFKRMRYLYWGVGLLIITVPIMEHFHITTELNATAEKNAVAMLQIAAVCVLLAALAGIYITRKLKLYPRIMLPLVLAVEVAVISALVSNDALVLIHGLRDFPAGKTHTQNTLLKIARVYHKMSRSGGQSRGKYIQLMPAWTWDDLKISDEDYKFAVDNSESGETGYYEVTSDGRFCARLTIEQSDKSIRILHSSSDRLPKGTVILCPTQSTQP